MSTRLVLIRHGTTSWNKEKRYCGYKDIGLNSKGRLEVKQLCKKLEPIKFDAVYSSDRKRAAQTARIIFQKAKITKLKGLREISFGVLEGLRHKEILKKYPVIYEKWLADPYKHSIPKSESLRSFKKRVTCAMKNIVRLNPGKTIAVVCHGGTIGIFITSIRKTKDFWRYIPRAASMTVVEYKKGKPAIKLFNHAAYSG